MVWGCIFKLGVLWEGEKNHIPQPDDQSALRDLIRNGFNDIWIKEFGPIFSDCTKMKSGSMGRLNSN